VAYLEILKANLDKYIERQCCNHFLHRLRKNLREKINNITQILETRDTLDALTQQIKSVMLSRFELRNKISERELFSESRNNFRESSYNRKQKKTASMDKTRDNSATTSCQESTSKLSLCSLEKVSNSTRDKCIYYNCDKKRHIAREYSKSFKDNLQVNAVGGS